MYTSAERQKILDDHLDAHDGRFDAAEFANEARSKRHPAHDWFTWDDKAAAEQMRLSQARSFISGLRINFRIETIKHEDIVIQMVKGPAVISPMDTRQHGGGYVALNTDDPDAMDAYCHEAVKSLEAWLRRYEAALVYVGSDGKRIAGAIKALQSKRVREVA